MDLMHHRDAAPLIQLARGESYRQLRNALVQAPPLATGEQMAHRVIRPIRKCIAFREPSLTDKVN
jgi:hypothetical protein